MRELPSVGQGATLMPNVSDEIDRDVLVDKIKDELTLLRNQRDELVRMLEARREHCRRVHACHVTEDDID